MVHHGPSPCVRPWSRYLQAFIIFKPFSCSGVFKAGVLYHQNGKVIGSTFFLWVLFGVFYCASPIPIYLFVFAFRLFWFCCFSACFSAFVIFWFFVFLLPPFCFLPASCLFAFILLLPLSFLWLLLFLFTFACASSAASCLASFCLCFFRALSVSVSF